MFKDKERAETLFGVLFGVIVVVAACVEMVMDGFSASSVIGAVKDIAGTAIVFVVMLAFINEHKKVRGFRGSIESKMKEIEQSYTPLIRQAVASDTSGTAKVSKLEKVIRYEIAGNPDALFGTKGINYSAFFDIDAEAPQKIEFYIRRKYFGGTGEDSFEAEKIADKVEQYIKKHYPELDMMFSPDASGGKMVITFPAVLESENDVDRLINIIDDMTFAYVSMKQVNVR